MSEIVAQKTREQVSRYKWINKVLFGGLRDIVLKRDNYSCVKCGLADAEHRKRWNRSLAVDHIDGFGYNSKIRHNTLDNLQTLCVRCHSKKDGYGSKRWARATHCRRGHEYTKENTIWGCRPKGSYRKCRICTKKNEHIRYHHWKNLGYKWGKRYLGEVKTSEVKL